MTTKERNDQIRNERERWSKENIGRVNSKMTYEQWLRNQSAEFQDDVLGKTKGKLFRNGDMTLDKFVSKSGHVYNLDELKTRNAAAFKKANVD